MSAFRMIGLGPTIASLAGIAMRDAEPSCS